MHVFAHICDSRVQGCHRQVVSPSLLTVGNCNFDGPTPGRLHLWSRVISKILVDNKQQMTGFDAQLAAFDESIGQPVQSIDTVIERQRILKELIQQLLTFIVPEKPAAPAVMLASASAPLTSYQLRQATGAETKKVNTLLAKVEETAATQYQVIYASGKTRFITKTSNYNMHDQRSEYSWEPDVHALIDINDPVRDIVPYE